MSPCRNRSIAVLQSRHGSPAQPHTKYRWLRAPGRGARGRMRWWRQGRQVDARPHPLTESAISDSRPSSSIVRASTDRGAYLVGTALLSRIQTSPSMLRWISSNNGVHSGCSATSRMSAPGWLSSRAGEARRPAAPWVGMGASRPHPRRGRTPAFPLSGCVHGREWRGVRVVGEAPPTPRRGDILTKDPSQTRQLRTKHRGIFLVRAGLARASSRDGNGG
jgi:hypothetical protein